MAIDVGPGASDRGNDNWAPSTIIDSVNPANATGTIDTCQVYAANDMSGIEYAAFIDEGSDVFSTNGDTNGSNLGGNAGLITHTAAGDDFTAFAIATGEYLGIYYSGGSLDRDTSGGNSWKKDDNDYIPCSSQSLAGENDADIWSIYATGTEGNGAVAPTGVFYGPLIGPLGGPI